LQVVFAVRTLDEEDLKFLDLLLARNPGVYRRSAPGSLYQNDTLVHWQESYNIARPDRLYVKIDDDVIFIQVLVADHEQLMWCLNRGLVCPSANFCMCWACTPCW
jgi:hypothetical protein